MLTKINDYRYILIFLVVANFILLISNIFYNNLYIFLFNIIVNFIDIITIFNLLNEE